MGDTSGTLHGCEPESTEEVHVELIAGVSAEVSSIEPAMPKPALLMRISMQPSLWRTVRMGVNDGGIVGHIGLDESAIWDRGFRGDRP